ncbi:MAG TPA: Clp protease N-terminal domain-containing protein [Acidimicrobiales bacterium]
MADAAVGDAHQHLARPGVFDPDLADPQLPPGLQHGRAHGSHAGKPNGPSGPGAALGVSRQAAQQRHGGPFDRFLDRLKEGRFLRFTPRARTAVVEAQSAARARNHDFIGTEHIVLGLRQVDDGVAAHVLAEQGVAYEDLRAAVVDLLSGHARPSGT